MTWGGGRRGNECEREAGRKLSSVIGGMGEGGWWRSGTGREVRGERAKGARRKNTDQHMNICKHGDSDWLHLDVQAFV